MKMKSHSLTWGAKASLFISSYTPMFFIIVFRPLPDNVDKFNSEKSQDLMAFLKYFGASSFFLIISIFGLIGIYITLKNLKRRNQNNGTVISVVDIENKNSESITYLFTYLIPFVFQDLTKFNDFISLMILLGVTYGIYTNSSLIVVNPILSLRYSLYLVESKNESAHESQNKKIMILTDDRHLSEGNKLKIKKIGHKLFYAETIQEDQK